MSINVIVIVIASYKFHLLKLQTDPVILLKMNSTTGFFLEIF